MATHPQFTNLPNNAIRATDGQTYWHSRSCAVVAEVLIYSIQTQTWSVLLGQRGTATPDFQGFWGLPCGYLDWNETLCDAVVREVWEECGLYLPSLSQHPDFIASNSSLVTTTANFSDTPWHIADSPQSSRQNISFHYAVLLVFKGQTLPELSNQHADDNEVTALAWIPVTQALQMTLAFNHTDRLATYLEQHADSMTGFGGGSQLV